jgi:hypothetical protein
MASPPSPKRPVGYYRRPPRRPSSLVASAQKLDPLKPIVDAAGRKPQRAPWQSRAWTYYDEIGEVWFAMNVLANAMRKARFIIAKPNEDPTAEPEPVGEDEGPDADQARAELDRIQSDVGGQGEIIAGAALNLSVAGECYLVGWSPPDDSTGGTADGHERWDILSSDQVEPSAGGWRIRKTPTDQGDGYTLTKDDFIARIWRRHPRWLDLPDCPMRAVLGSLDELLILSRAIRAAAVSRAAGNGILIVPSEISFPADDVTADEGDGNAGADAFQEDLEEVMTVPIQEPDAASGAVPLVLRVPADYADKIKHITLERPLDEGFAKQREELIRRIANGLDLPAEVLLGLSSGNHWSAWLVDDVMFSSHIEPLLHLICWAVTDAYLRPALEAAGVDDPTDWVVWYDATAIVKRPNQAQDATDTYDRGQLSGEALRRYKGFTEADAPTDEEKASWDGAIPQGEVPKPGPPLGPGRQKQGLPGAGPGEKPEAGPGNVESVPPEPKTTVGNEPGPSPSQPVTASGARRSTVGRTLLDLERATRYRIAEATDAAVFRTLERAGASLRRRINGKAPYAAVVRDVANGHVAATLGREHVRALGVEEQDLTDDSHDELRRKWLAIVAAAQFRVASIARDEGADIDPDEYVAAHAGHREAGLGVLLAGVAAITAARLYSPSPSAPPLGEHDTSVTTPMGLIRSALDRAGGATGTQTRSGGLIVQTPDGPAPALGLTGGPDAAEALAAAGLEAETGAYTWTVGGPTRPFEPHQDLDGITFDRWDDDQLAAQPDEFPYVDFYWPQDHAGCQCDALLDYTQTGNPAPLVLTPDGEGGTAALLPEEVE